MHVPLHASDGRPGLTEIDLADPRVPRQFHEPFRLGAMLLPPVLDPTLHRRIRASEPLLGNQTIEHPSGGMPLFAWHRPIGAQP